MDDPPTLIAVLQNAIGLGLVRQRQTIVNFGFDTCNGLKNSTESDLRGLFSTIERNNCGLNANQQVRLNLTHKSRMYALREEFIMREACGAEMGLAMLILMDTVVMDQLVEKHRAWSIAKEAASSSSLKSIEVPKLTKKNWKEFSSAVNEALGRQQGVNSVPLLYVTREVAAGDYEIAYLSTERQLMACLRHAGENYNTDKESVYSLLVEYAKDSEIESIVEQFKDTRNGRAAWNAIMRHMQSTSYMDTLKTDALASIKSVHYIGEKKDFGMTKYYAIHSTAHNNLDTAGEPMSDGMKITHFCNGLKDSIAIHNAITTKSDPNVNTFEEFYIPSPQS